MLVCTFEGARSLSRFSIRLKDNIKTDLREIFELELFHPEVFVK